MEKVPLYYILWNSQAAGFGNNSVMMKHLRGIT
jgi:hypothetical protein